MQILWCICKSLVLKLGKEVEEGVECLEFLHLSGEIKAKIFRKFLGNRIIHYLDNLELSRGGQNEMPL